jgi:broad specificity phosphatase PhoE
VRHGQYEYADTDEGCILTELGRQQAAATGRRLAELTENGAKINRVVVSTMTRAMETADLMLEHLPSAPPQEYCDLIREGAVYVCASMLHVLRLG